MLLKQVVRTTTLNAFLGKPRIRPERKSWHRREEALQILARYLTFTASFPEETLLVKGLDIFSLASIRLDVWYRYFQELVQ